MSIPVLYIAGTGRSGSTVLANILGEVEGLFAGGEIRYLWQRGVVERRLCGCGVPVPECPVWAPVLSAATGVEGRNEAVAMAELLGESGRIRRLPRAVAGRDRASLAGPRPELRERLATVYAGLAEVTGSRVIVDSSKLPAYAHLLATVPGIDLRVVHLVRDPRGAAHSWSSKKSLPDGASRSHMEQIGPAKSAVLWDVWNAAATNLLDRGPERYLRVRYEDFVADPTGTLNRILALVGLEGADVPVGSGGRVTLGLNHTVAGNPDRLHQGVVTLRADDRWRTAMPARHRRLVTALTAPLLVRFGYPLRAPRGPNLEAGGEARGDGDETIFDRAPRDESARARFERRVRRHLRWGQTEGFGRLIEEDQLNPITRVEVGLAKWRWRTANRVPPGSATPVYLVGLQRSGTNMLARGLDCAPEFEVRNENDRTVFDRFQLRSDEVVRTTVLRSRHRFVLFKPLCDSHRVDHLLDGIATPSPGRAIWAYRDVDGRVRSAVSKFGRNNLFVLRDIVAGKGADMWQAQRLSPATLATLAEFDYAAMSPENAAALLWWARNGLYFEMELERRHDVCLASYQELLADPGGAMARLCRFLELEYRPALTAHIAPRAPRSNPLALDPRVRALCDQLQSRLDDALLSQRQGRAA